MVVDLVDDSVDNALGGTLALVVLDNRLTLLGTGPDYLQGWEALDAKFAAKGLVFVFIAVDRSDLGEAFEVLSGFLVGGLEVLAVATPGGVELDDL